MAGLRGLLETPGAQYCASALVVFGVQRLVPTMDPSWYKSLKKPKWTPPNYVFPMVWIPLKLMQSAALAMVWRSATQQGHPASRLGTALAAFGVHLFLGNWWNVVFFGRRQLKPSLPVMYTFWGSIAATAVAFKPINETAAMLMLPTLVWVTIAAKLNYDIVQLNISSSSSSNKQ